MEQLISCPLHLKKDLFIYTTISESVYNCHNPKVIKFTARIRLGLTNLQEHKFKHSFQGSGKPLYNCGRDVETTTHSFLHCSFFINERRTFLSIIRSIDTKLLDNTSSVLTETILFGGESHDLNNNFRITLPHQHITTLTEYILPTKKFDKPLL